MLKTQLSLNLLNNIKNLTGNYPSEEQQNIISFILNEKDNLIIQAVAGAGKSSTLLQIAVALAFNRVHPSNFRVLVFGKDNSLDLKRKFSSLGKEWEQCSSTLHSFGFTLVRNYLSSKIKLSNSKYAKVAKDLGYLSRYDRETKTFIAGYVIEEELATKKDFLRLIDLCRVNSLTQVSDKKLRHICSHHGVSVNGTEELADIITHCLEVGNDRAMYDQVIDFTDMIYLPYVWGLQPALTYQYLLIDEVQDLNSLQRDLALKLSEGGRVVSVGDIYQSCLGFTGADNDSMKITQKVTKAKSLPLTTCYRCPVNVLDLVRTEYPNIEIYPREGAPEGRLGCILDEDELYVFLKEGDMILSRRTRPLVSVCLKLIGRNIKAFVKGRDIGVAINAELDRISKNKYFFFDNLVSECKDYMNKIFDKYKFYENREEMVLVHKDKVDCITTIFQNNYCKNIQELKDTISGLFQDSDDSPITMCTIHRSKGMEADRVFIIEYDILPFTWVNQRDWQYQQEENLHYVAMTRAKKVLGLVHSKEKGGENLF